MGAGMDRNEPLVSVIVPVYNGQEYLENYIRSIQEQTYGNLEILIVNDGSTDATGSVCDKLAGMYDNVRVLTLGDEGVSAGRNAGIEAAKGELITFVDADDRLRPDMLRTLYECMTKTGSEVAGCRFFSWRNEEDWEQALAVETVSDRIECYEPHRYLRDALLQGNSRCWSKLYRRKILEKVQFREKLTIGEDLLFLVNMLPYAVRIAETDYPGYGYFQNPGGAINREFTPGYMDQVNCWQLVREAVRRMDQSLDAQVCTHYAMGIMLTAGKLARLKADKRRAYQAYIDICHERLREVLRVPGVYGRLSAGYKVKTRMFLQWPGLYLYLYHMHKERL